MLQLLPIPGCQADFQGDVQGGPKVYLETLLGWAGGSWYFPPRCFGKQYLG